MSKSVFYFSGTKEILLIKTKEIFFYKLLELNLVAVMKREGKDIILYVLYSLFDLV